MKRLLCLWALALLIASPIASAQFKEGTEYQRIATPVPTSVSQDKVEVVELFWYGCPHCFKFEPFVKGWLKNKPDAAEFVLAPATLNKSWTVHARTYYSLEALGEVERLHETFFKGIHEQRRKLRNLDSIARFLAQFDVDEDKFREAFNSFAVDTKIKRDAELAARYGVTGVPAVIVAGKYRTSASMAGGYDKMIEVINYLVEKESET